MIILIGESGAGKDTILNELVKRGYKKSINYTTRQKRIGDDDNLVFVTKEEFEKLWNENKLVQRAEFNNEFYGISIDSLGNDVVTISITKTIQDIKNKIKELNLDVNLKCFYISVPEKERIKRMKDRGDKEESIKRRLELDIEKFKDAEKVVDYVVENMDLDKAVEEIMKKM